MGSRGTFVHPSILPSIYPSVCPCVQITASRLKSAHKDGQTNERKSPCVLQDIVPFGAAALLPITYNHQHTKQGNGYRWPHIALGRLVYEFHFWTSLLLPKWSGDLKYGPCPPARDLGSRVSGLVCNNDSKNENFNSLQKYGVQPIKWKGILHRLTIWSQKLGQYNSVES